MNVPGSNQPATTLLRAEELSKSYHESDDVSVLKGVSVELHAGECVALLGASGSGKSTLLHCLGLLDRVDTGKIFFRGHDITRLNATDSARFRLEKLGFVFQFHHLIPELTALENVVLPSSLLGRKENAFGSELLALVGLGDKRHRFPWQLSGGEQQRVALARALINKPALLLTDEATGNLDHSRAVEIIKILLRINKELGTTLLSVTHDEELAGMYQRQYRLKDGRIWDWLRKQD